MPRRPDLPCADCGQMIWRGGRSLPEGKATCRPCRRNRQRQKREHKPRDPASQRTRICVDCGTPCVGLQRCRTCNNLSQRIRSADDSRVKRWVRERSAPGLTSYQRTALLRRWKRQGKQCTYCSAPATTIDHVLPLIRGGTNHEGNLTPCCRQCNSSKAGWTVVEWRTGKRLTPMKIVLPWIVVIPPQPKPKPLRPAVQLPLFRQCAICNTGFISEHGTKVYCSIECCTEGNRRLNRDRYRTKMGLPVDPTQPTKRWAAAA